MDLNENLTTTALLAAIRIRAFAEERRRVRCGTGFLLAYSEDEPWLEEDGLDRVLTIATNAHVVRGAQAICCDFLESDESGLPDIESLVSIETHDLEDAVIYHPEHDLAVVSTRFVIEARDEGGLRPYLRPVGAGQILTGDELQELPVLERVIMTGHPAAVMDAGVAVPLLQQGHTATPAWHPLGGRPDFLLDRAVVQGL